MRLCVVMFGLRFYRIFTKGLRVFTRRGYNRTKLTQRHLMPKAKSSARKIQVQFHLAQRNYKRIIKRMRTSLLDPLDPIEATAQAPATLAPTQAFVQSCKQLLRTIRAKALRGIAVVLEMPYKHEARVACLEFVMSVLFAFCALLCVVAVLAICFFLFGKAVPTIMEVGVWDFLLGDRWMPTSEVFGIFPMIIGSLLVSVLSVIMGAAVGVLSAVYLAYFCKQSMLRILTPCVELLAGIPSIVYGFFGLVVLVEFVDFFADNGGKGLLTASLLLAIMILPTIILISKTSIEAVPKSYYEGAIALGASKERAVFFVVLKAARSGILASIVLGMGRAIGEAMAVIIVAGNQPLIPESITDGVRTLTTNIVMELGYAEGLHRDVLIACGVVLFAFILLLNLCFRAVAKRL